VEIINNKAARSTSICNDVAVARRQSCTDSSFHCWMERSYALTATVLRFGKNRDLHFMGLAYLEAVARAEFLPVPRVAPGLQPGS
jgi:hypothetical protein